MPKYEKISKSSLTPEQQREAEQRSREAVAKRQATKSKHFLPETGVLYKSRRYTVNQIIGRTLILLAEDGSALRLDNPYFMR